MKNCEKFCLLDWRGEEKLTVEIPRRRFWWPSPKFWWATPPKLSGRHSKEANENKEEEIEYDINNIMFKWPQRPRYLKLSFSDSKIREAILRRQTQFLSTETAWITLGGQKTKKKSKSPNSQVTQSVWSSSQPPAECRCAKTPGVWRLCWKCTTIIITTITTTTIIITTIIIIVITTIIFVSAAGASPARSSEVHPAHLRGARTLKSQIGPPPLAALGWGE